MINLEVRPKDKKSVDGIKLEDFNAKLLMILNSRSPKSENETPWTVSHLYDANNFSLKYRNQNVLKIQKKGPNIEVSSGEIGAHINEDIIYAVRYLGHSLGFKVYSKVYNSILPKSFLLFFDYEDFTIYEDIKNFFQKSQFTPIFAITPFVTNKIGKSQSENILSSQYFALNKEDNTVHIINNSMLAFIIEKENQAINGEFSYKVAESMDDFSRKYDLGIIPFDFYMNYKHTPKLVNKTLFDIFNIDRKVFINPSFWEFNEDLEDKISSSAGDGMRYMDKVQVGEDLDSALKRIVKDELKIADDYVGAEIESIEFDRDKESVLTPRLKMNVYINDLAGASRKRDNNWVSISTD